MKTPSHSLFLKTEWKHKIAAGTFSAVFKCTFQLYRIHLASENPHICYLSIWWLTAGCCKCHRYLINTLSVCTPLDSLCPYHPFIASLPSTWQERHLWLLSHGSCCLWKHLSCIHPITTESIPIAAPVTTKLLLPTRLPRKE